jgi:hypothetical protein
MNDDILQGDGNSIIIIIIIITTTTQVQVFWVVTQWNFCGRMPTFQKFMLLPSSGQTDL